MIGGRISLETWPGGSRIVRSELTCPRQRLGPIAGTEDATPQMVFATEHQQHPCCPQGQSGQSRSFLQGVASSSQETETDGLPSDEGYKSTFPWQHQHG